MFIFLYSFNIFMYKMKEINWGKKKLFLKKNKFATSSYIFFFKNSYIFSLHQLIPLIDLCIKILR